MNNKYILLTFAVSCILHVQAQNYLFTQRGNNQRTGAFTNETTLNTSNVNLNGFGKLYSYPVDGQVYAQPLYVHGLNVSGKGKRNVLFIATMHNSIYACDADSLTAPLWHASLAPSCKLPDTYFDLFGPYHDIKVEIGITSTPVIDSTTNTLYALTFSKENGNYYHKLYAIDIATGNLKMNSPVTIGASIAGTGVQSTNGIVTFDSKQQLQRTALVLSNGIIYIIFASYGDRDPYHGWVLGYNANNLAQKYVFNTSPNGTQGGIWMTGQGPSVDVNGDLYMTTGNGDFNANTGGTDYGDTFMKLHPTLNSLSVTDYFTPYNQSYLNSTDADLGVDAPIIIPNSNMIVGSGKEGKLYVIDRTNMGKYNASSCNCDNQILQSFGFFNGYNHSSVAYWEDNSGGYIYGWSENDYLKAFKRNGNAFVTTPSSQSTVTSPGGDMPGGVVSVTSNGLTAGTGVVWANIPLSGDSDLVAITGVLRAFDATDLTKELWNSNLNSNRDAFGKFAKFNSPVIVNGKVYQPTFSGQVSVYGLNPPVIFRAPDNPAIFSKGLNYKYYEGSFSKISDFNLLTPINIDSIPDFSLSSAISSNNYALSFHGYINISSDGLYDFYLNSDDGSNLLIGNSIVVDNDGLHASQEVHGSIQLKAGKHSITVNYFQVTGPANLNVSYAGNGISKMPVPDSVLFRDPISYDSLNSINNNNKGIFLNQNFPNPVFQNSKIEFGVNHPTNVVISLYHIDGTLVKTLFQGNVNDNGSVDVNANALASGMYIYKMTTDNAILTRSLLVVK